MMICWTVWCWLSFNKNNYFLTATFIDFVETLLYFYNGQRAISKGRFTAISYTLELYPGLKLRAVIYQPVIHGSLFLLAFMISFLNSGFDLKHRKYKYKM